MSKPSRKPF